MVATARRNSKDGGEPSAAEAGDRVLRVTRPRLSGLVPSVGTAGDGDDNAVIESFWGRLKTELLNRQKWRIRIELSTALFEYLAIFHNRTRRHSSLGMLTPVDNENLHRESTTVA